MEHPVFAASTPSSCMRLNFVSLRDTLSSDERSERGDERLLPIHESPFTSHCSIMPSFDIVSELNAHEVANAIDQSNREVSTRFDFKGTDAKYELKEFVVTLVAQADFQLKQMMDILKLKLAKRGVDVACMKVDEPVVTGQTWKQTATLRQGVDTELGKKIQRLIKDSKLKVQAAIQDKQVRVTGKSRDDLQEAIALVRGAKLELPLQFTNFRD
jgi:cyclic-di-GMP-binding protein